MQLFLIATTAGDLELILEQWVWSFFSLKEKRAVKCGDLSSEINDSCIIIVAIGATLSIRLQGMRIWKDEDACVGVCIC